jgi:hypothetical protein
MTNLDNPFEPRGWAIAGGAALLIFGIALPIVALVTELMTGMCAGALFDPIPTPLHMVLVLFVPASNAWVWFVVAKRPDRRHHRWAPWINAIAIGVAGVYSVMFLPSLPLSTVGILFYGLGLLPWAPVTALISALRLRVHLERYAHAQPMPFSSWKGILIGIALLAVIDVPATITRIGVHMAISPVESRQARGLHLLRVFGSEDTLLRMCYVRSAQSTDLIGAFLDVSVPITSDAARDLYYRTTGRAFNSVPPPVDTRRGRGRSFRWWPFDFDQGTGNVGERVEDLWLASSRLDGSVDAVAALGYLEWTMVFRNASSLQREARAQIALPPGAVVSRVTLWIDGEEREAAFAGRRETTAAYRAVVSQRRDPVLVTSAGPDRISLQLFPVQPRGEMKLRIGMTIPLALRDIHSGVLRLPYFHERNFDVRDSLRHSVWIESKSKLSGMVRAEVKDEDLSSSTGAVVATRGNVNVAWSPDSRDPAYIVRQLILDDAPVVRPKRVVLVVDGSGPMSAVADEVARSVARIPDSVDVRLVFAHDGVDDSRAATAYSGADVAREIRAYHYVGGHDNTSGLVRALDLASAVPDSVLIWVHGPQPVLVQPPEALLQRLSRGAKFAAWYELQVIPGRNLLTETTEGHATLVGIRSDDLERMTEAWRSGGRRVSVVRERISASAANISPELRTSDHLVRLWANDEIGRMVHGVVDRRREAIELAARYQLVTAVSGAVVLESQAQYDAAGLQPVPEGTVPTIPEPEEWALIVVALLVIAYACLKRRSIGRRLGALVGPRRVRA